MREYFNGLSAQKYFEFWSSDSVAIVHTQNHVHEVLEVLVSLYHARRD